jgi:serine/threonine-protein kinase PknK
VHRGGTTARGEPFIVMDLMSGGSLAARLRRDGVLPWAEVVELAVTTAGALETAHRAGVLHLDVKPANLLVSRFGETKLSDFGIARMPGVTETISGQVRASAAYTAPERLLDGIATVAADLYGLGATMFALLTGRPAFVTDSDEDLIATVARVVRDPLPDLRERGVPDAVAGIVERLMAKTPDGRYASASDVAVALQSAQRNAGRPVTRTVIEGTGPRYGDTITRPDQAVAPPPWALSPGALSPTLDGLTPGGPIRGGPAGPVPGGAAPTLIGPVPGRAVPPSPSPARTTRTPSRRRSLVLTAVAAVVVIGLGVAGAATLLDRTATPVVPMPTTAPSTPAPSIPAADPVALDADVVHPAAADVRAVLRGYITGINERRYADAFAYYSPDSAAAKGGLTAWTEAQSTSSITDPAISAVRSTGDPNAVEVDVRFTSTQDAEHGPNGQTCTNWELAYDMAGPGPGWLIRGARTLTPPRAC